MGLGRTKRNLVGILSAAACLAAGAGAGVVQVIPGFRATYPGGQIGANATQGIPSNYVKIPPAREYYLDYLVWFENDFEWVKGGKLPGLVGGTHTSGCRDIESGGWSARFMWHANGGAHFYYYHFNRVNDCGDVRNFPGASTLRKNAWNRITERVVVNTPGQADGLAQAWLNGAKVVDVGGVRWRGNVPASVAQVDQVSLQTFYGGSTQDWAPSRTTHSRFSVFVVRTELPDFSVPFDTTLATTGLGFKSPRTGRSPAGARAVHGAWETPLLPPADAGARLGVRDLLGRPAGVLARERGRWEWAGGAPVRAGILVVRPAANGR